jgi:hypothetical protein
MEFLFLIILILVVIFSRALLIYVSSDAKHRFPIFIKMMMIVPGFSFAAAVFFAVVNDYIGILTAVLLWVVIGGSYLALVYARIK